MAELETALNYLASLLDQPMPPGEQDDVGGAVPAHPERVPEMPERDSGVLVDDLDHGVQRVHAEQCSAVLGHTGHTLQGTLFRKTTNVPKSVPTRQYLLKSRHACPKITGTVWARARHAGQSVGTFGHGR